MTLDEAAVVIGRSMWCFLAGERFDLIDVPPLEELRFLPADRPWSAEEREAIEVLHAHGLYGLPALHACAMFVDTECELALAT